MGLKTKSSNRIIFTKSNQIESKETPVWRKTTIFFFWANKKKPKGEETPRKPLMPRNLNKKLTILLLIMIMIIQVWLLVRCRSKNAKKSCCKTSNLLFTFWVLFLQKYYLLFQFWSETSQLLYYPLFGYINLHLLLFSFLTRQLNRCEKLITSPRLFFSNLN